MAVEIARAGSSDTDLTGVSKDNVTSRSWHLPARSSSNESKATLDFIVHRHDCKGGRAMDLQHELKGTEEDGRNAIFFPLPQHMDQTQRSFGRFADICAKCWHKSLLRGHGQEPALPPH